MEQKTLVGGPMHQLVGHEVLWLKIKIHKLFKKWFPPSQVIYL